LTLTEEDAMRKRRLLLVGVGALALLGLAAFWLIADALPRPGITERNYRRIQMGMTLEEVQGILGEPPSGDVVATREDVWGTLQEVGLFRRWQRDGLVVMVEFKKGGLVSDSGVVTDKCFLRWHDQSRRRWEVFDRLIPFTSPSKP
jgi:hypothetical protein